MFWNISENQCSDAAVSTDSNYYSCATEAYYDLLVNRTIDHMGGKLSIMEIDASLTFPKDAVWGRMEASISTCSYDDDYPPMRSDQILMGVVLECGPAGCFNKPALLEMPHSANVEDAVCDDDEEGKDVEVWCKTTSSGEELCFAEHSKKWIMNNTKMYCVFYAFFY